VIPPAPPADRGIALRETVVDGDVRAISELVLATGFFSPEEVGVAVELVEDRLGRGPASDYAFLIAEREGRLAGYTCYGRTRGTLASFDLYWIVVAPDQQRHGLGRLLLEETERRIRERGGLRIYVETSSRSLYEPTRQFYLTNGYVQEAFLADYYSPGDGKLIYCRVLGL
jgi:GNAT superfamily N-acetyltransferase